MVAHQYRSRMCQEEHARTERGTSNVATNLLGPLAAFVETYMLEKGLIILNNSMAYCSTTFYSY